MDELKRLEKQLDKLLKERVPIQQLYDDTKSKFIKINTKIKDVMEKIDTLKTPTMSIPELLEIFPETRAKHNARNAMFRSMGLHAGGGYWQDTNQAVVHISLYQDDDKHRDFVEISLKKLLPHIKPAKNGGHKRFDIFEYTFSEHGVYHLHIYNDKDLRLNFCRYGHNEYVKTFNSLADALKYIQHNHYYQKSKGSYD